MSKPNERMEALHVPEIPEFSSWEHRFLGDAAVRAYIGQAGAGDETVRVELAPGVSLAFGEVVAMAGDYFESIDEMRRLAGRPGTGADTAEELRYVQVVRVGGEASRAKDFTPAAQASAERRERLLAQDNRSHFLNPDEGDLDRPSRERHRPSGPAESAGACYLRDHERALAEAHSAGKRNTQSGEALACEAFACHFLTDGFASGHLRTARRAIQDYWNRRSPRFFEQFKEHLVECITAVLKDHRQEVGGPWWLGPAPRSLVRSQTRKALEAMLAGAGFPPYGMGDLVSMALHDYDNRHGVRALVGGASELLYGDEEVIDEQGRPTERGQRTGALAIEAVRRSVAEVRQAYEAGRAGRELGALREELLSPASDSGAGLYAAERLLPQVLSDADQERPTIRWRVETWQALFGDPAFQEAAAITANGKHKELQRLAEAMEVGFQREAFWLGVVVPLGMDPLNFLRQVLAR